MGVPRRFSTEYPERCLQLISALEEFATEKQLLGSFGLLAAASVLTVPFERAAAKHFMHRAEDDTLTKAIESLKKVKFPEADFWAGEKPSNWRMNRVIKNWDEPAQWLDNHGKHPLQDGAENVIEAKSANDVLRALRNALAHGNVVYLNKDGEEKENSPVYYLTFLSRYEETPTKEGAESYRLIVTTEGEFLRFVKCWALWIAEMANQDRAVKAA